MPDDRYRRPDSAKSIRPEVREQHRAEGKTTPEERDINDVVSDLEQHAVGLSGRCLFLNNCDFGPQLQRPLRPASMGPTGLHEAPALTGRRRRACFDQSAPRARDHSHDGLGLRFEKVASRSRRCSDDEFKDWPEVMTSGCNNRAAPRCARDCLTMCRRFFPPTDQVPLEMI